MRFDVSIRHDLACHRCLGELYLSVTIPHTGWLIGDGGTVKGKRIEILCPTCDAAKPAAAPLLTFFTIHPQITEDTMTEFTNLVHTWLQDISPTNIDDTTIDAAVRAWRIQLD